MNAIGRRRRRSRPGLAGRPRGRALSGGRAARERTLRNTRALSLMIPTMSRIASAVTTTPKNSDTAVQAHAQAPAAAAAAAAAPHVSDAVRAVRARLIGVGSTSTKDGRARVGAKVDKHVDAHVKVDARHRERHQRAQKEHRLDNVEDGHARARADPPQEQRRAVAGEGLGA